MARGWTLLVILCLLPSCMFGQKAQSLSEPEPRPKAGRYIEATLSPKLQSVSTASIGDIVFSYTKTGYSAEEVIAQTPPSLKRLPRYGWIKSHKYDALDVYSNPTFYEGQIGAAVNAQNQVLFYVQTSGVKSGKEWDVSGTRYSGPFFGRPHSVILDGWTIRYGGRNSSAYKFEIVTHQNETDSSKTQSFEISEESFLKGFAVRGGYVIHGLKPEQHGMITYTVNTVTEN